MTIWLRFGLFRAFSMHVGNEPFLTFIARNIFCFGIKGIPSSIYEIGDRYHLPKSQLWTASFAFPASKIWAKHFDDQPCSHMHNCIPKIQDTSQHISNSHYNAENEMTNEFLKTSSWLFTYVASTSFEILVKLQLGFVCQRARNT